MRLSTCNEYSVVSLEKFFFRWVAGTVGGREGGHTPGTPGHASHGGVDRRVETVGRPSIALNCNIIQWIPQTNSKYLHFTCSEVCVDDLIWGPWQAAETDRWWIWIMTRLRTTRGHQRQYVCLVSRIDIILLIFLKAFFVYPVIILNLNFLYPKLSQVNFITVEDLDVFLVAVHSEAGVVFVDAACLPAPVLGPLSVTSANVLAESQAAHSVLALDPVLAPVCTLFSWSWVIYDNNLIVAHSRPRPLDDTGPCVSLLSAEILAAVPHVDLNHLFCLYEESITILYIHFLYDNFKFTWSKGRSAS